MQQREDSLSSTAKQVLTCETRVLGGRYRVRRVIGRGLVADVYLGDDLFLERVVAIKIPHQSVVEDVFRLEQFRRDAISLAGVRSPNIVGVYDIGTTDEGTYLIMQHIEGRTIEEEVRRFGPLTCTRGITVLTQLLAGLAAMHGQGLVHGDIRSSNVLLARNGKVVLLDLGIILSTRGAESVIGKGTPHDRTSHLPRAFTCDVYDVGQLILFMLTGVDAARRSQRVGFEDLFLRLPAPLAALARRALDTDPAERFASAGVMKKATEVALELPTARVASSEDRREPTMTATHVLPLLTRGTPPPWNGKLELAAPMVVPVVRADNSRILVVEEDPLFGASVHAMLTPAYRVSIHDSEGAQLQLEAGARFNVILCGLANPIAFHAALLAADSDHAAVTVFLTADNIDPAVTAFLDRVTNKRLARPFEAVQLRALVSQQIASSRRAITSKG